MSDEDDEAQSEAVIMDECTGCGKKASGTARNAEDRREYYDDGLCQMCRDERRRSK